MFVCYTCVCSISVYVACVCGIHVFVVCVCGICVYVVYMSVVYVCMWLYACIWYMHECVFTCVCLALSLSALFPSLREPGPRLAAASPGDPTTLYPPSCTPVRGY